MTLEEKLGLLPEKPGIYIMKDKGGRIIYIGKAKSLKNRVRQYFQSSKNHTPKVRNMVSNIHDFEYIITNTEVEALILESNLIKRHKPKYNILLKDDKHYPYIRVTLGEDYPRLLVAREIKKGKDKYFGPYPSSYAVNQTIEIIHNIFPLKSCNLVLPRDIGKQRPCLNYHIKRCLAPCQGIVNAQKYRDMMEEICVFLAGRQEELIDMVEQMMYKCAQNQEFERAASLRDQLKSLKAIRERQKIIFPDLSERDVVAVEIGQFESCVYIFFIRKGKMLGGESFILTGTEDTTEGDIIEQFIQQFYSKSTYIPKEVLIQAEIEDNEIISSWLSQKRGSKVEIKCPQRGEKLNVIKMARENAKENLDLHVEKIKRELEKTQGAIIELKTYLGIDKLPRRIEAFDISHIQGTDPVASMVVFENGKASNKEYRRFKIKTVEGPDDYGSMKEIIYRRYKRVMEENLEMPDLIMVDGGQGQVNAALLITDSLGVDVPVCGIVKDDRHRTRGLIYKNEEISVPINSKAFRLMANIQDEVHRFAIGYHRSLRSKALEKSVLDDIPKIGPSRKRAILTHFNSIDDVKKASVEDLAKVKGVSKDAAQEIYDFFRKQPKT